MNVSFDFISDLHLSPNDHFNWDGKATSLYCLVAGNVSSDLKTVGLTLSHLAEHYQGVFYIMGPLEYQGVTNIDARTDEIINITRKIPNVAVLYHHVVIIDGIAVLGCNGWVLNNDPNNLSDNAKIMQLRYDDIHYLKNSIEKLQRHLDVTKIVLLTTSVPKPELYFGEMPKDINSFPALELSLLADTQAKVSYWLFGTYGKIVDTTIRNINYISNPYVNNNPYWAKRVEIEI